MSHIGTYADLEKTVNLFYKGFADETVDANKPTDWYAIFSFGSVVAVNMENEDFEGYTAENYDFPSHRTPDDPADLIEANKKIWEAQREIKEFTKIQNQEGKEVKETQEDQTAKSIIKKAFKVLLDDGYPYPGGEGADRIALPLNSLMSLWTVYFSHRSKSIFNCVHEELGQRHPAHVQMQIAMLGGDLRRYDYMGPEIKYLISPKLTLYTL